MGKIVNIAQKKIGPGCFSCCKFGQFRVHPDPDDDFLIPDKLTRSSTNESSIAEKTTFGIRNKFTSIFSKKPPKITVFVGTWNMNGRIPSTDPHAFLDHYQIKNESPDLLIIGTQECERPLELSLFIPSKEEWEKILYLHYSKHYCLVSNQSFGGLQLSIYAKKSIISGISHVQVGKVPTGDGGLSNKGGIGVSFKFHEFSFLIINSHLCAHQSKVKERNHDYLKIELGLKHLLGKHKLQSVSPKFVSDRFDFCFWIGDLNYRVDGSSSLILKCIKENRLEVLLNNDQLLKESKSNQVFKDFKEEGITFPPTYKFHNCEYMTSRSASWSK